MLAYDQPISPPKPDATQAPPRPAKSFSRDRSDRSAVAAEGCDRGGRADLRLLGGHDRQESDAALCRDRAALCRSPRIAVGGPRADAAFPGYFGPVDGGRKPGAADHLEQRAAARDRGHQARQGSGVRRRDQQPDGNAVEAHQLRRQVVGRCQCRQDVGAAGRLEPPHQRQADRPHLCGRYRSLVDRAGQGRHARQRRLRSLPRRIQAVAGRRRAARHQRPVEPAQGTAGPASHVRECARGLQGAEQFRRHPGYAGQRPAAFGNDPAAGHGACADARCAGQIRPDRGLAGAEPPTPAQFPRRCSLRPSPICARNMPRRGANTPNSPASWGRCIRR